MGCRLSGEMRESVRISDMKIFLFNVVLIACDNLNLTMSVQIFDGDDGIGALSNSDY